MYSFFETKFHKIEKMVKKNITKEKKMAKPESMSIQEQTFGLEDQFNDYEIENNENKVQSDKSFSVSDTSSRLQPVKYYSYKSIERDAQKRKNSAKLRERSKSQKSRILGEFYTYIL